MEIALTFEPLTEEALVILRQLERVHLVRAHEPPLLRMPLAEPTVQLPQRKVDLGALAGSLDPEIGEQMQRDIAQSREEWERDL